MVDLYESYALNKRWTRIGSLPNRALIEVGDGLLRLPPQNINGMNILTPIELGAPGICFMLEAHIESPSKRSETRVS